MELEFVRWLSQRLPRIGDDAAVIDWTAEDLVVTSDMLMDGIDFELDRCDPFRAGRKSLAVNLSDIAAMAARPVAAIVSLALPHEWPLRSAQQFYEGILQLAEQYEVEVVGGDTNRWPGPLVISVTVVAASTERGPLRREGGQVGDELLITGSLGGSILGRHFDFTPRVHEALALHGRYQLHAAIDVSDGLALDLWRLSDESGCGARIELNQIPISEDARQLAAQEGHHQSALDHALGDGEDFELLLAAPPEAARRMLSEQPLDVPLTSIGNLVGERGLWARSSDKGTFRLPPRGYEH